MDQNYYKQKRMNEIWLNEAETKHDFSRGGIFWKKSYMENIPIIYPVKKIVVVSSLEYIVTRLGISPNNFKKIHEWIKQETKKLFEEYKLNPNNFPGHTITGEFLTESVLDINYFIENEA